MANYPTSLDTLTNPVSTDPLDAPPHATQHADANDILEAVETKLGTGASVPTTTGHVLTVTGAGATAYQAAGGGQPTYWGAVPLRAGAYHGPHFEVATRGTAGMDAGTLRAVLFIVGTSTTVDRIGVEIVASVGGGTLRLGVYNTNSLGYPSSLAFTAGTVSTASSGFVEITISQTLAAGVYALAVLGETSDTCTVTSITATGNTPSYLGYSTGITSDRRQGWFLSGVSSGSLPDPFTGGASVSTIAPRIVVRAA